MLEEVVLSKSKSGSALSEWGDCLLMSISGAPELIKKAGPDSVSQLSRTEFPASGYFLRDLNQSVCFWTKRARSPVAASSQPQGRFFRPSRSARKVSSLVYPAVVRVSKRTRTRRQEKNWCRQCGFFFCATFFERPYKLGICCWYSVWGKQIKDGL